MLISQCPFRWYRRTQLTIDREISLRPVGVVRPFTRNGMEQMLAGYAVAVDPLGSLRRFGIADEGLAGLLWIAENGWMEVVGKG